MAIIYERMTHHKHVLERPDTYVGNTEPTKRSGEWVVFIDENNEPVAEFKEVTISPALERIFVEILSNALDNMQRGEDMKYIKIDIDKESGKISISNDGAWIVADIHPKEKIRVPQMIFGDLLTGSNYDDSVERSTSGRNGYGAKLTNIFSSKFILDLITFDGDKCVSYNQEWSDNMKNVGKPKISASSKKPCTKVSWIPDFKRFVSSDGEFLGYGDDIISVFNKLIYDASMISGTCGVGVYLNGKKIKINSLKSYSKLFASESESLYIKNDQCEVLLTESNIGFVHHAFSNGVYNSGGGSHVNMCSEAIFRPLMKKFNKAGKPQASMKDIKNYFQIFVVCTLVNPKFTGQSKTVLASPKPKKISVTTKNINTIFKWSASDKIRELLHGRELASLKRTDKKKKFVKIDGYDPANLAGTSNSDKCSLILTEGLSAKTFAVLGIQKGIGELKGRDYFGIFPLRGKLYNCRQKSLSLVSKNKEITNIISALGLQHGVDYTDPVEFAKLNYSKIIILCDADVDGLHIQGLIINFLDSTFPSLLRRDTPFITSMETPIVRVFEGRSVKIFYDEPSYNNYISLPGKEKLRRKYHKGLGTSSDKEVLDVFGKKMTEYVLCDESSAKIDMAFSPVKANFRKLWLANYKPTPLVLTSGKVTKMSYKDFIDKRLIQFSIDDNKRSIPHLLDGLKESQRKILFSIILKKLNFTGRTMKVAQLAGFVAEKSAYHHGEQCLFEAITKLAADIIGMNNIPLLYRDGQFGTRLSGGKDASAARYIFTKLDSLTRYLFIPEDDALLPRNIEDGELIEPKFYVPIIPTVLINGCQGIGTGWSCTVPLYNPKDLITEVRRWIKTKEVLDIKPWYRGFTGTIEVIDKKIITTGVLSRDGDKVIVTELPIGKWTDKFKNELDILLESKMIKSVKNYSTPNKVNFEITELKDGIKCTIKNLKLTSSLSTSNLVMYVSGKLRKFDSVQQIISVFCQFRLKLYEKRKAYIISKIEHTLNVINNKHRFLTSVMDEDLVIWKRDAEDISKELEERKYDKIDNAYDYLLDMNIRSFTKKRLDKLLEDVRSLNDNLSITRETQPQDTWLSELKTFEKEYDKWLKKSYK